MSLGDQFTSGLVDAITGAIGDFFGGLMLALISSFALPFFNLIAQAIGLGGAAA